MLTADLAAAAPARGLPRRATCPDNKEGLGKPAARSAARSRELHPAKVGVRAGHVHQHRGRRRSATSSRRSRRARAARRRRRPPRRRAQALEARAATRRPSRSGSPAAAADGGEGAVHQRCAPARAALRPQRASRSIDDPNFVSALVFDRTAGEPGVPKSRFAYLFPSKNAALIQVRLRAGPDRRGARPRDRAGPDGHRREGVPAARGRALHRDGRAGGGRGARRRGPERDLRAARRGAAPDGGHARARLPHAAAAAAAGARAGRGGDDLRRAVARRRQPHDGVDRGAAGADRPGGGLRDPVPGALRRGARAPRRAASPARRGRGGRRARRSSRPGLATAVGFLVLLLSPVPMVRGFGALLVVGIVLALGCAALRRASPRWCASAARGPRAPRLAARRAWPRSAHPRVHGGARVARGPRRGARSASPSSRPRRVLAIGLAVAVVGLALDTQSEVVSDVRELVPQDLQALKDVNVLQEETGVSGEIDVTDPRRRHHRPEGDRLDDALPGRRAARPRLPGRQALHPGRGTPPELCPALSLPDLFGRRRPDEQQVRQPARRRARPTSPRAWSPRDRKTANLAFGIRLMPLDRQKEVVDDIKARLEPAARGWRRRWSACRCWPPRRTARCPRPWRRALTLLAALAGVFLVLLAARRSAREAAVPLIPIALATGWSGLRPVRARPAARVRSRCDLNPMSVTLGALVIAISTEFSVLLSSRYRQEREGGRRARRGRSSWPTPRPAPRCWPPAPRRSPASPRSSSSDIRMLRDFGIVTVVDLTVSLLGVMLVLPAALLWAEEHGPFRVRDLLGRGCRPRRAQPRRAVSDELGIDDRFEDLVPSASGSPSATARIPSRCAGPRCRGPATSTPGSWAS